MIESLAKPTQHTPLPAALERLRSPRDQRFASLLSEATRTTPEAKPATLVRQPLSRNWFMQNMSPELRRSAVQDKAFVAAPAALERARFRRI